MPWILEVSVWWKLKGSAVLLAIGCALSLSMIMQGILIRDSPELKIHHPLVKRVNVWFVISVKTADSRKWLGVKPFFCVYFTFHNLMKLSYLVDVPLITFLSEAFFASKPCQRQIFLSQEWVPGELWSTLLPWREWVFDVWILPLK